MGVFKQIIIDANNKILNTVCDSIIKINNDLKDELQSPEISRKIPTIKFVDAVALRCFLRDTKYLILIVNSTNNNLIMYKGKLKNNDSYWEAANHYKTIYGIDSLDDDKVMEEIAKNIDDLLK